MSVKRCKREVDSREFTQWIAYSRVNPFGQVRGDLQAGIVASQIYNSNRTDEKQPIAKAGDYILKFDPLQKEKPKINDSKAAQALLFTFAVAQNARQGK